VRFALALTGLHQRFVHRRVERLALRLDALEPFGSQRVQQLRVDELDPLEEPILVHVFAGVEQGELEVVEHLEQPAHHRLRGHLDRGGLLAQHALAVVVELGLQPLQVRAVLVDLRGRRGRLIVASGNGRCTRPLAGDVGEPTLVGDLDHRRLVFAAVVVAAVALVAHEASPSSTISPSTTSSSVEAASSEPGVAPSAPAAPSACWVFWYIA
jgi:hypothetical protein